MQNKIKKHIKNITILSLMVFFGVARNNGYYNIYPNNNKYYNIDPNIPNNNEIIDNVHRTEKDSNSKFIFFFIGCGVGIMIPLTYQKVNTTLDNKKKSKQNILTSTSDEIIDLNPEEKLVQLMFNKVTTTNIKTNKQQNNNKKENNKVFFKLKFSKILAQYLINKIKSEMEKSGKSIDSQSKDSLKFENIAIFFCFTYNTSYNKNSTFDILIYQNDTPKPINLFDCNDNTIKNLKENNPSFKLQLEKILLDDLQKTLNIKAIKQDINIINLYKEYQLQDSKVILSEPILDNN